VAERAVYFVPLAELFGNGSFPSKGAKTAVEPEGKSWLMGACMFVVVPLALFAVAYGLDRWERWFVGLWTEPR